MEQIKGIINFYPLIFYSFNFSSYLCARKIEKFI